MGIRQEAAFRQNSEVFKRLSKVTNVATLTPQERYDYEADLKIFRDTINQIRGAREEDLELGVEKGIEIGETRGMHIDEVALVFEVDDGGRDTGELVEHYEGAEVIFYVPSHGHISTSEIGMEWDTLLK